MSYIVAGVVLLLSLIVGTGSYLFIPRIEENTIESDDENKVMVGKTPATKLSVFFAKANWKQWSFVVVLSVIGAILAFLSHNAGNGTFNIIRQITIYLTLMSAFIMDGKTHMIPNVLILGTLGIGILLLPFEYIFAQEKFIATLVMSLVGLFSCVVLFYILARLTKEGIGMGDVKLISTMGFLLGLASTLISVLFSLLICTCVAIFLLFGKKKNKNDKIPFGPFVFFGYILMLLLFNL